MTSELDTNGRNNGNTAGVILAAGGSTRFGIPKQLLLFGRNTFIEQVTETCINARLSPIIVVLGNEAKEIKKVLDRFEGQIEVIENKEWKSGQSSTLRIAISSIHNSNSTLFLLSDQPQISNDLIMSLIDSFKVHDSDIVAPFVGEKRANPVLFSNKLYKELANLNGDEGGRQLFGNHRVDRLNWQDERILIDVDTPEDYECLKKAYGFE